jgi:transposase
MPIELCKALDISKGFLICDSVSMKSNSNAEEKDIHMIDCLRIDIKSIRVKRYSS